MNKLPEDVIINNILPFTYKPQNPVLLEDVRGFYIDKQFLENLYYTEFNDTILLYDLVRFCNSGLTSNSINPSFETILRRNPILSNKSTTFIVSYILSSFVTSVTHNVMTKIKILWGILTPRERTSFINRILFNLER
uniref:Uncharacterized protein n=1 Tax=viral metagenome TaxID=1070528 RepID=A0A6C0B8Q2_9ZZZZ